MAQELHYPTLAKIQYGVFIITTKHQEQQSGLIATVAFQVSHDPEKIAVCVAKNCYTHELLLQSKVMGISILTENAPTQLIANFGYFSGKDRDKFKNVKVTTLKTGAPIVTEYSVAILEAEIENSLDTGTHTIFVGKVVNSKLIAPDEPAMTYEYYQKIKKGKAPKNAPTYHCPTEDCR